MNHLIFYSTSNSKGKHDATGAFIPEAQKLSDYLQRVFPYGKIIMHGIATNVSSYSKRKQVTDAIKQNMSNEINGVWFLDTLRGFCQYGFTTLPIVCPGGTSSIDISADIIYAGGNVQLSAAIHLIVGDQFAFYFGSFAAPTCLGFIGQTLDITFHSFTSCIPGLTVSATAL